MKSGYITGKSVAGTVMLTRFSPQGYEHVQHHVRRFHVPGGRTPAVCDLKIHIFLSVFLTSDIAVTVANHVVGAIGLVKS